MTTKELAKIAEKFGLFITGDNDFQGEILIKLKKCQRGEQGLHRIVASISKNEQYEFRITRNVMFAIFKDEHEVYVFLDAVKDYAFTPLQDRSDVKRYYLIADGLDSDYDIYLNKNKENSKYSFLTRRETPYYQTEFTQKEIDEMPDYMQGFNILPLVR